MAPRVNFDRPWTRAIGELFELALIALIALSGCSRARKLVCNGVELARIIGIAPETAKLQFERRRTTGCAIDAPLGRRAAMHSGFQRGLLKRRLDVRTTFDTGFALSAQLRPVRHQVVHFSMPTNRPRHQITESDEVAAVLDKAELCWPGVSRGQLVVRVLADWGQGVQVPKARRAARRRIIGSLPGSSAIYDPQAEWPA